jgi:hypothetical protein
MCPCTPSYVWRCASHTLSELELLGAGHKVVRLDGFSSYGRLTESCDDPY